MDYVSTKKFCRSKVRFSILAKREFCTKYLKIDFDGLGSREKRLIPVFMLDIVVDTHVLTAKEIIKNLFDSKLSA